MYAACGSRDWAGTSPTSPPQQPQGRPCCSRARTGAPDGISGGAFWSTAARQPRLHVTRPPPRSSRTASDVSCEHIADAGEGKRRVKTVFTPRMHTQQARGGQIGAGDVMDAVRSGRQIAWMRAREAEPSKSLCGRQPKRRLFARRRWTTCDGRTTPQVSRGASACMRGCNSPATARQRQLCAMRWRLADVKIGAESSMNA